MSRLASPCLLLALILLIAAVPAQAQRLFVGLESSTPPTRSSDLNGFPGVSWQTHFAMDVSGAAATPQGKLYLCNGAFTTRLYESTITGPPQYLSTISVDVSALAYGRGTLYGYSNYASPKGIYAIDPTTGAASLVLDVYTGTGYLFFALDYNPADDRFYGYTEYGVSGLYRIDIDSGEMTRVVGTIPAANGQGRGLAVGNNTVYLTATRGDEQIPYFAYDLAQGIGGQWVGFTNPYPNDHATGGAAWIPDPTAGVGIDPALHTPRLTVQPNPAAGPVGLVFDLPARQSARVEVIDVAGRAVALLTEGEQPAGRTTLTWEGRDIAPGLYFVRLTTPETQALHKLVVIR